MLNHQILPNSTALREVQIQQQTPQKLQIIQILLIQQSQQINHQLPTPQRLRTIQRLLTLQSQRIQLTLVQTVTQPNLLRIIPNLLIKTLQL